jgi:hypothetical protein
MWGQQNGKKAAKVRDQVLLAAWIPLPPNTSRIIRHPWKWRLPWGLSSTWEISSKKTQVEYQFSLEVTHIEWDFSPNLKSGDLFVHTSEVSVSMERNKSTTFWIPDNDRGTIGNSKSLDLLSSTKSGLNDFRVLWIWQAKSI